MKVAPPRVFCRLPRLPAREAIVKRILHFSDFAALTVHSNRIGRQPKFVVLLPLDLTYNSSPKEDRLGLLVLEIASGRMTKEQLSKAIDILTIDELERIENALDAYPPRKVL
jgi:hypothetical protein